jgi:hypothetical protein
MPFSAGTSEVKREDCITIFLRDFFTSHRALKIAEVSTQQT